MDRFLNRDLDRELYHLEKALRHGHPRMARQELSRYLHALHDRALAGGSGFRFAPEMHHELHRLAERAGRVRTPIEVRDTFREIRQYQMSLASKIHEGQVESRLRELEDRMKPEEVPTEPAGDIVEEKVITLDSLKGKKVLFAIMPFAAEFEDVWTGGIKRAASGTGLTPIRIDMLTQSSEITEDIVEAVRHSEVVVVDVTGNNPNVMFEFGFALASKKRLVVISQSTEFLTFDIKNLRTLIYRNSWQGIESLHKGLQPYIKGALRKGSKSTRVKRKAKTDQLKQAADD